MQRRKNVRGPAVKDASKLVVGVIASRFNADIIEGLLSGALETLRAWGVRESNISVVRVPGSFEIPYGCITLLTSSKKPDAIITLGCIIKGETDHDKHLAAAVTQTILDVTREYRTPISSGIITANNLRQAKARSRGTMNRGSEAAAAALECALLD